MIWQEARMQHVLCVFIQSSRFQNLNIIFNSQELRVCDQTETLLFFSIEPEMVNIFIYLLHSTLDLSGRVGVKTFLLKN